jgi:hypothetical protein
MDSEVIGPRHALRTLGHATMLILEEGQPLIATDPWLIGSVYWRSWWLEKYPNEAEIDEVRQAAHVYLTHSHPDHFHFPTLRKLGRPSTLHPTFPRYLLTEFLEENDFPVRKLEPWVWYRIGFEVEIASVPVPIDDSILIVRTPKAHVVNLNDSVPRRGLLREIARSMLSDRETTIVLKSYSPASIASSIFRNGEQTQMKDKRAYAKAAQAMAEAVGANFFVPFASQVFFSRRDSVWANDFKVKYEDLVEHWDSSSVDLLPPFVEMNLDTFEYASDYATVQRSLGAEGAKKVAIRHADEDAFELPADFASMLSKYLSEIYFLRILFRRGIGWRLTTSGHEFVYRSRTRAVVEANPDECDVTISLPDKVLYESLENNVLTDLGITMFIKVETRVSNKLTYGLFLLMGLHDYGHFSSVRSFARFCRFYLPYTFPFLLRFRRQHVGPQTAPLQKAHRSI